MHEGLAAVIKMQPGTKLVGEACNGRETLELFRTRRADVALMDLRLPATGRIRSEVPGGRA